MAILSFCGNRPIALDPTQWEAVSASAVLVASVTNKAITRIVEARCRAFGQALAETERSATADRERRHGETGGSGTCRKTAYRLLLPSRRGKSWVWNRVRRR